VIAIRLRFDFLGVKTPESALSSEEASGLTSPGPNERRSLDFFLDLGMIGRVGLDSVNTHQRSIISKVRERCN
jgi:hypothetical protein